MQPSNKLNRTYFCLTEIKRKQSILHFIADVIPGNSSAAFIKVILLMHSLREQKQSLIMLCLIFLTKLLAVPLLVNFSKKLLAGGGIQDNTPVNGHDGRFTAFVLHSKTCPINNLYKVSFIGIQHTFYHQKRMFFMEGRLRAYTLIILISQ